MADLLLRMPYSPARPVQDSAADAFARAKGCAVIIPMFFSLLRAGDPGALRQRLCLQR